jgi:uncharacterized protein involved in exopolysaccharide biosynthesis
MADEVTSGRCRHVQPSPTRRDIAAIFFRQRRVFVLSFFVVLLAAALYGVLARSYSAEMKILVRRGRLDLPMSATPSTVPPRYDVSDEELNSEAELLKESEGLRKVVLATHLEDAPSWRPSGKTTEERIQRAMLRLANRLTVEPVRKTRLLRVRYESSDAEQSARVLNTLAAVYMEKHLAVHRPSGESHFFDEQVNQRGNELIAVETTLLNANDRGVIEPSLQRDITLQKLADADRSYREASISIVETEERIGALKTQLASLPERATTQIRTADNPQLLEKMKSTLLSLQLRRGELLTRFEPSYRLVREVDEQIEQTKATITAEALTPIRDEITAPSPQYEWAKTELDRCQVELRGLRARAGAAQATVVAYQRLAAQYGRDAISLAGLQREAKAGEESYLFAMKKREEARIGDALDERGVLNATVVQQPFPPAIPKHSPFAVAGFGMLLATLIATGFSFAADYFDGTFRTPTELRAGLDTPVLAWLPRDASDSKKQARRLA